MKVHEIMTGHPRFVAPENTLIEAAGLMRELDVGVLPVSDGGQLAGIVTDRDLVIRGLADGRDPNEALVRDVMSGGLEFVYADQEVEDAAHLMESRQIRRLPVLDRDERLVGIVSLGDIATSSNPAFSGMALRDVSTPNQPNARRRRLERQSATTEMPKMSGMRRGPATGTRRGRTQPGARRRTAAKSSGQATGSAGNRRQRKAAASSRRSGKTTSRRSRK